MATIIGTAGSMSEAADRPALVYYIIFPKLSSSSPKSYLPFFLEELKIKSRQLTSSI